MLFCPRCANLLLIDGGAGGLRWKCQTCPFTHKIEEKMRKKVTLETRKDDAVYGESNFRAITEMGTYLLPPNVSKEPYRPFPPQLAVPNAMVPRPTFMKCRLDQQTNLQLSSTNVLVAEINGRRVRFAEALCFPLNVHSL